MRPDTGWQTATANGFGLAHFAVDWQNQQLKCPEGKVSQEWKPTKDHHGKEVIHVRFARSDCANCVSLSLCTRSKDKRRAVSLRPQVRYEALQELRKQQATPEFQAIYNLRAGVESTLSQAIRTFGLRKCRYIGLAKTYLQHLATATAINVVRAVSWLAALPSDKELELKENNSYRTAPSRFGALAFS